MSTADYVAKYPRRNALLASVETYWLDEPRRPQGQLESSLKKHTTLLNRLKSALLVGPADAIIKEIDGLVLTKYLEEIVAAIIEGASRGRGDSEVAVDIIVHLHTRLAPDFLPMLLPQLLAILSPTAPATSAGSKDGNEKDREKEDKERISRQRPVMRILAELAMVGAWAEGSGKGAAEIGKVLKNLMINDPQYSNMPLLSTFLKYFGRVYLGSQPAGKSSEPDSELPSDVKELVPVEVQKKMRELFVNYFETASKTLVKGQLKLLDQDKRNHEAYIKSGEIFEDRQHAYERMTRAVERLTTGVQGLADLLGLSPPTLPTAASLAKSSLQIVNTASSFTVREDGLVPGGIWDDEEERRFYEDLPDLAELVPPALLGIKEKRGEAKADVPESGGVTAGEGGGAESSPSDDVNTVTEAQRRDEEEIRRQIAQLLLQDTAGAEGDPEPGASEMARSNSHTSDASATATATIPTSPIIDDEPEPALVFTSVPDAAVITEEDGLQSGPAARLSALFAALPEAVNREMVDKLAIEFGFLNSKAARNRLVKFIGAVPKNRTDLLPHYARFVAILDRYMPDVGSGIIETLDEELRYLQRKRTVRELDSVRLKNVRFYGELAKFKVARPYTILHVLKVFLDDFRFNVENIANLLETCGRFLLRNEETAETAKGMVELMRRKQSAMHLDQRLNIMLENAFYQCNPPERVTREVVELPPMQSFIQHLIHDVLMKRNLDKVLKLLRKLHWEDDEVYQYILTTFTEVWEIKFGNISNLAALVYDLQRYHAEFGIYVVDQVVEDIRIGMEENIFKFNQRRIASIKYLGELYMYRLIGATVIFDTLWSLLSFGHAEGLPIPGRDSPIDSVTDFFRVRLACTLLDTCGACFDKGSQKRKLDHYLVILQLYTFCKAEMPLDVDFMLSDTLDTLRPKVPHLRTFAEAAAAVDELLAAEGADGNGAEDDESEDDEDRNVPADARDEEIDEFVPTQNIASDDDGDDDDVVVIREQRHDEFDEQAQVDFDREFARMLADTTVERKSAPPIFDQAVPMFRKRPAGVAGGSGGGSASVGGDNGDEGMKFMLLSKKGNKPQVRSVDIPVDSTIANNLRTHQLASKAEQEQLKHLVLQNEKRQEKSELQAIEQTMRNRGIKVRLVPS